MNKLFKTRMPIMQVDGVYTMLLMGTPEITVGAEINIRNLSNMTTMRDFLVSEVTVCSILDTPARILDIFKCTSMSEFRMLISEAMRVGLPAESDISIVQMSSVEPVEEDVSPEEDQKEGMSFEEVFSDEEPEVEAVTYAYLSEDDDDDDDDDVPEVLTED